MSSETGKKENKQNDVLVGVSTTRQTWRNDLQKPCNAFGLSPYLHVTAEVTGTCTHPDHVPLVREGKLFTAAVTAHGDWDCLKKAGFCYFMLSDFICNQLQPKIKLGFCIKSC